MQIFGQPIKDHIPISPGKYHTHETWRNSAIAWKKAFCNHHKRDIEKWTEHTLQLSPLRIGDHILLKNQAGHYICKWDKTSLAVEVPQFNQYLFIQYGWIWRCHTQEPQVIKKLYPSPSTGNQDWTYTKIWILSPNPPNPMWPLLSYHHNWPWMKPLLSTTPHLGKSPHTPKTAHQPAPCLSRCSRPPTERLLTGLLVIAPTHLQL